MNAVIMDIMVYLVYLFLVLIVSMGNRDPNAFYMKTNLQTTLVHGGMLCDRPGEGNPCDKEEDIPTWWNPQAGRMEPNPFVDFLKVREVNQWWQWLNTTLLPNVRVQNWYNGDPPYGLRGYLDDRVNRIIGYALVRQVIDFLSSRIYDSSPGSREGGELSQSDPDAGLRGQLHWQPASGNSRRGLQNLLQRMAASHL